MALSSKNGVSMLCMKEMNLGAAATIRGPATLLIKSVRGINIDKITIEARHTTTDRGIHMQGVRRGDLYCNIILVGLSQAPILICASPGNVASWPGLGHSEGSHIGAEPYASSV